MEATFDKGWRSPKTGHLGVYFLSTGPDPAGPRPGERVQIVLYDKNDKIIRRLEEIKGNTLDPGYVDFFNSFKCRPSVSEYHIIDIDAEGKKTILATHTRPSDAHNWFVTNTPLWIAEHYDRALLSE